MTTHTPATDVSHDQPPLPNQYFSSWLRGHTTLFISQIVAILGSISFLASLIYYVSHISETGEILTPENVKLIIDYAHIVFMVVFILALIQVLDDNERGSYHVKLVHKRVFNLPPKDYENSLKRSKEQLRKFKRRFLWFWIGMLCLYISFACQQSYKLATESQEKSSYSVDMSVVVKDESHEGKKEHLKADLNYSTTDKAESKASDPKPLSPSGTLKKLIFPFLVFLFNNVTLLSIFQCFLVMYIPSDEETNTATDRDRKYWRLALAVVGLLTFLFVFIAFIKRNGFTDKYWDAYSSIFDALSGVLNALVLALLIARLDSKLVGLPSWLISILYSYAAVQPLFIVFELHQTPVWQTIATGVLIFVFLFKVYFFLIIIYALQTGRMLNYLFCFRILRNLAGKPEHRHKRISVFRWLKHLVSRFLRRDYPLEISKWLGLIAISFFFVFLIFSMASQKKSKWPYDIETGVNVDLNVLHQLPTFFAKPVSIANPNSNNRESHILNIVFDGVQIVAVSLMLLTLVLLRKDNGYGVHKVTATAERIFKEQPGYSMDEGKDELKRFKKHFLWFWLATLLLYLVFLFDHLRISFEGMLNYLGIKSQDVLNPFGLQGKSAPPGSKEFILNVLFYPFLEFSVGSLNLLFIFWCFVVLQSPAFNDPFDLKPKRLVNHAEIKQKRLINYSGFIIALLVAMFPLLLFLIGGRALYDPDIMMAYATVFNGVTGTLSAVALALLIAKMDNTLFLLPSSSWATRILFAYASIQPLFIAFVMKDDVLKFVQASVLTAALGLKICFFLIVAHSLQSGKMLNYLICFPFLRERVNSIFENQFEIRLARAEAHSFTFSILKKNQLYYSAVKRFKSREECDNWVHYLRERMKERDAYLPKPQEERTPSSRRLEESGTYWVEIITILDRDLICESIPLKSEDEVDELIRQSMEKIPYCKYNRI